MEVRFNGVEPQVALVCARVALQGSVARLRLFGAALLSLGVVAVFGSAAEAQGTCAPGFAGSPDSGCVLNLSYTGSPVTVSVPAGVELRMQANGASGELPDGSAACQGQGFGGVVEGDLAVTAPETLTVEVGGIGGVPTGSN